MTRIAYVDRTRFNASTRETIRQANAILAEYAAQGITSLTARQVYYQFVARDLIPNKMSAYKNLTSIIADARMAGLMDWEALEDRTRYVRRVSSWANPEGIIQASAESYHLNHWATQDSYVEVWIEKDALVGLIESTCREYDLPYFSTRGYGSASELWRAGRRLGYKAAAGKDIHILHLGDHDPSGLDMTRDIEARLNLFVEVDHGIGDAIHVNRLALNMEQVDRYNPPPNPAKLTDTRSPKYIEKFGRSSWELDALAPNVLTDVVVDAVQPLIDWDAWEATTAKQEDGRSLLEDVSTHWDKVARLVDILREDDEYEPGEPDALMTDFDWTAV